MATLRELRERAGLRQMDVAARVGSLPAKVSAWELGRTMPPTRHLAALAEVYSITADELLKAIEESRALSPGPGEDRRRRRDAASPD